MRKFLFLIIGCCSLNFVFSQSPDDVVRNAWFVPMGTARSTSIGGAIGALGGDISAIYTNPAGLGFYKTREAVTINQMMANLRQTILKSPVFN